MLSMGLMAMLRGPVMFMDMGVLMATGWAMFMPVAVAGMFTEAILTGAVMVTGCCRLTGAVIFNVLEEIVMGLLMVPRFMLAVVAEAVTGVAEAELHALLVSKRSRQKNFINFIPQTRLSYGQKTIYKFSLTLDHQTHTINLKAIIVFGSSTETWFVKVEVEEHNQVYTDKLVLTQHLWDKLLYKMHSRPPHPTLMHDLTNILVAPQPYILHNLKKFFY